jgi:hypothetical protein
MFSFELYDRDDSGAMSTLEIDQMLKDSYGKSFISSNHAKALVFFLNCY